MRINFIAAILMIVSFSAKAADDNAIAKASLKNVTIYRIGAEMQQSFKVSLKAQTQFIEVTNVSSSLERNSLQIKSNENVTVLGFEFYNSYLNEEIKSPEYKRIEDSLLKVKKEIKKLNANSSTLKDLLSVLNSNKEIKGSQTGLSVAELIKMMDYYKQKSNELKTDISDIDEKISTLNETANKLNNQLQEEKKSNTDRGGKLVIQITCNVAGTYNFELNYLTPNASWIPFYDIKTANINSPFNLVYKAKITQTTGIDWKQVKLKLSTALPNETGTAPILQQWLLDYVQSVRLYKNKMKTFSAPVMAAKAANTIQTMEEKNNGDLLKNIAFDTIALESSSLKDYVQTEDNGLSVVYDIDLPYDISTNGKEQTVAIQSQNVNANYKYYCVPKLQNEVYLLAEVPNWSSLNLLDGEANLFFENGYVGKNYLSSNSTQDTLNLTIGNDKRITVKREKLKDYSSTKFLSGNKVQTFTYEITVKNNKSQAIDLMLKDQYPISANNDITVDLLDNGNASINNTELGILTWKISLQPNEQKKIRFQYSVKYPKDKQLSL